MRSVLIAWCLLLSITIYSQEIPCDPIADDCDLVDWTLGINLDFDQTVATGDYFCVPFTVTDFTNILSMQFTITYDPYVLEVDCDNIVIGDCLIGASAANFNCPTNTSTGCNTTVTGTGDVSFVWFNPNAEGICCSDGSTLFEVCFTAIGTALDATDIILTDNITDKEIVVGFDIFSVVNCPIPCEENPAHVDLLCTDLSAIVSSVCGNESGMDDGSFCFQTCGGTAPYNYTVTQTPGIMFDSGVMTIGDTICYDNLAEGTYIIALEDATGTTNAFAAIVDILPSDPITYDINFQLPSCWDRCNGSISIDNLMGGVPDYCFNWSNGQAGTNEIMDLCADTYYVTIEDAAGCQIIDSIDLLLDTLMVFYEIVDTAACSGIANGKIKVWAEGGIPFPTNSYEINDSTARDTLYICNIEGGECIDLQAFDNSWIPCGSEIVEFCMPIKADFMPVVTINDSPSCHGICDGFVQVQMPGATKIQSTLYDDMGIPIPSCFPGCPFVIYGSFDNTTEIMNLCAGNYTLEVVIAEPLDLAGCSGFIDFEVVEPDTLVLSCSVTEPSCTGAQGTINCCATTGGTPPLTFKWSDGFVGCERDMLDGGIYEVTVCDANNCTDTKIIDLPAAGSLNISIDTISLVSCDVTAMDGALEVIINSAGSQFTIEWKDDNNMVIGNTAILANIGPGTYFVKVVDDILGCEALAIATLEAPPSVLFDVNLNIPDCYGAATGGIGIEIIAGEEPITYQWDSSPLDMSVLQPIAAGTYCVTVFDALGCSLDSCIVLPNPDSIALNIITQTDALCFGENNGSITIEATGGSTGATSFNYFIYDDLGIQVADASGNIETINSLGQGCYTILATDVMCTSPTPIPFCIDQPDPISLSNSITQEPSCFDYCDGSITAEGSGGTGNLTYQWLENPTPGPVLDNICSGWHLIEISDDNGCVTLDSVFLNQPDSLFLLIDPNSTNDLSCNTTLGSIGVTPFGGTPDFTFNWEGNISMTNIAQNLGEGTYNVTVTDANSCTADLTYSLVAPSQMTMQINDPEMITCFGGQTCISIESASGGVGDISSYTFSINNGPSLAIDSCINVIAGPYVVTVFDSSGCSIDTSILIDQPAELTVDLGPEILEIELGDSTTLLQADINPNLTIDTIIWTPMEDLDCKDPLCQIVAVFPSSPTIYQVEIIDENGCMATDQIEILIDDNRNVYVPTAFSPNDDGVNDQFQIFVGDGVEEISYFAIFDRWGEKVFEETSLSVSEAALVGWDGRFKGTRLNPAVFAYLVKVKFIDGREINYKGPLTLIR